MRSMQMRVAGRLASVRRKVVVGSRPRRKPAPGFFDLAAKLAWASDCMKQSRHGRRSR